MSFLTARQHLGLAALLLVASTILSRLMGLIRDKIISWQFGAGSESDLYFAAFVVPDLINYLLAGGFMSITAIPLLAKCFKEDEQDAWQFFSAIFYLMSFASLSLTLLAMIFADKIVYLIAPGFDGLAYQRLTFFMRLVLPAQIFFLSGASLTALLYLRRQFFVPALAPIIYNGCIILCGLILPLFLADIGMTGYCVGVTLGAFLGAFLLPLVLVIKQGLNLHWCYKHRLLPTFIAITLPLMLGQTVVSLDEQFCRIFGSMTGEGSVSLLNYAKRITQVPIGLVGQAAAVASYPFLVSLLAEKNLDKFNQTLNSAFKTSLILIIPCASWLIIASQPVLGLIFQGGKFSAADTALASPLLQLMLIGTPAWVFYMILARAYYAHSDTLTPAWTGTILTLLCLPIYYFWAVKQGAIYIVIVSIISVALYCIWLIYLWYKRFGGAIFQGLLPIIAKTSLCSIIAGLVAFFCQVYSSEYWQDLASFWQSFFNCLVSGVIFCILFVMLAFIFARDLLKPLKQYLLRSKN